MYVCKIKHILSVIHYTICGVLCFQFAHYLCDDWENIYPLSYIIIIKSEVWTHCLGLAHETMICAVCFSIFLVTMLLNLKDCMFPINKNPSCEHVSKILSFVFFCPMLQRKSRSQVLSAIRSNIGLSPSYSKGQDPAACILICSRQWLYCNSTFAAGEYL